MTGPLGSYWHYTRGLRFRLTLAYVLFFTVLLGFLGVFFRQTLRSLWDQQTRSLLDEEWVAVRGYLRIERNKINWYYDRDDPEEALIVDRLKQVYLLTDAQGTVKEKGPRYDDLLIQRPDEIRAILHSKGPVWQVVSSHAGDELLMRQSVLMSEDDKPYFLVLGRSYTERNRMMEDFTRYYAILLPLMILSACVVGWFVAGRALSPVNDVAGTAQRITGYNLSAEIPLRGANDELDRLIEAFNRMIERLNATFIQTRQFSTDVSHELRTPLTAIRGQLEVALMSATTPVEYQEAILNALEDVERLSKTIRALLLLSQAESGQLALQVEKLDIVSLIDDLVEQFQIPAEGAGLRLTADLPNESWIAADRVQVERLVSNLLSNSVKYTPEGGAISVSLKDAGAHAEFVLEDTGLGIAPDHLPHIFDRFYRVPNAARGASSPERGLGLGLSFVAWIVKAHRGKIAVQSTLGKGTRFTVQLPKDPALVMPEDAPVPTFCEKTA